MKDPAFFPNLRFRLFGFTIELKIER